MDTITKKRKTANQSASKNRAGTSSTQNGHASTPPSAAVAAKDNGNESLVSRVLQLAPALIDYQVALAMVFGGCCSNAWSYERLLTMSPGIGSALTFFQMLFITLHTIPSFLTFQERNWLPRLKERQVPLRRWAIQVLLVATSSLLNNWAYAYHVPLTILIVFRSAGLAISMLFGYLLLNKRYTPSQILCVTIVSTGVILTTISRPASKKLMATNLKSEEGYNKYLIGVSMMVVSSVATGLLGLLQELTYQTYGPCWKEGVFYTHSLSLPIFIFLFNDVKRGISSIFLINPGPIASVILLSNLVTQLICVSGVNRLNSQMTSVSTNLVLTTRKAVSLCFSVWWFGNGWNTQFGLGAAMVFLGSVAFSLVRPKPKSKTL